MQIRSACWFSGQNVLTSFTYIYLIIAPMIYAFRWHQAMGHDFGCSDIFETTTISDLIWCHLDLRVQRAFIVSWSENEWSVEEVIYACQMLDRLGLYYLHPSHTRNISSALPKYYSWNTICLADYNQRLAQGSLIHGRREQIVLNTRKRRNLADFSYENALRLSSRQHSPHAVMHIYAEVCRGMHKILPGGKEQ